jgi:ankyrin repeat protein
MSFQDSSKDIKRLIGYFLDDKDILNYSVINKDQYNNICNEEFFHNILLSRYPNTLKYKNTNFKKYFLWVINYVYLLHREYGFDYKKYGEGSPKRQYKIFKKLNHKKDMNELLDLASKTGELSLVKFAAENGANIDGYDGWALQMATRNGHLEIVKYLVEHGADIHKYQGLALRLASQNGHLAIVKYLMEHGANIYERNDEALRWASEKGHLEVVKYLVEHGANIHACDDIALRYAIHNGYLEVVKYLVDHGADIHVDRDEALRWARQKRRLEIVKYLSRLP